MFSSLLSRSPLAPRRRSKRLSVEMLELRDCPATLTLEAFVLPNHVIELRGSVLGDFVPGAEISFVGAVAGQCSVDELGQFQFTTAAGSLGDVTAVARFGKGMLTPELTIPITVAAPTVSLSILNTDATTVTYHGILSGIDYAGQLIAISGGVQTAVTDSQGFFSFTMPADGLGMVSVSATDLWGQISNLAQVDAPPPMPPPEPTPEPNPISVGVPPLIYFSGAEYFESGNYYRFFGQVSGDNVAGLTVTFSGLFTGTTIVDENGNFSYVSSVPWGTVGVVYAQTTQNDQLSNRAEYNL